MIDVVSSSLRGARCFWLAPVLAGALGCASVSGVDAFSKVSVQDDASVQAVGHVALDAAQGGSDAAQGANDGTSGGWEPGDVVASDDVTVVLEGQPPTDGPAEAGDADANTSADVGSDAPIDVGPDVQDASDASDGRPPCTSTSCGGCCTSAGDCVGGLSATTCGTQGALCEDCTSKGQSCNAGTCSSAPHDAGACTTMQSCITFSDLCIPVWQQPCCKTDGTCGCYITIPPGPCR